MKLTEEKSLALTGVCTRIVLGLIIVFGAVAIPFWNWFSGTWRPELAACRIYFIITTYVAMIPAIAVLLYVMALLNNLRAGEIFVACNVSLLRAISWCCAAAFAVCLISALYYLPFLLVAGAAGMMALLLNAVKNCFGHAVAMKNELDLTV